MEQQKVPTFKKGNFLTRAKDFFHDPLLFSMEKGEVLGDFFEVPLLFKHFFITTHPKAIDYVLRANNRNYVKSAMNRQLALAFGNGLITSKGDFWRKQRRLMQPAFSRNNMAQLFGHMLEAANRFFDELEQKIQSEQVVDIAEEMMDATATIAMKAFFSSEKASDQEAMYQIIASAQDYLFYRLKRPYLIPFSFLSKRRKLFYKNKEIFDQAFYRLIAERRLAKHKPDDLLTTLLETKDENTGKGMTNEQLRDEMVTLFSAGHETSANGLAWILYCLANNPDVLLTVQTEIETKIGKRAIEFRDLPKLRYTRQVIEEGMRLYPPVWAISREAVGKDQILGYDIPAGAIVFINVYGLHRNPLNWNNPDDFNPDRFSSTGKKGANDKYYMPFGLGPRKCIGSHFAMTEMILLLAMFVQRFNFRLCEGQVIKPKAMVTLKPEQGILMHLESA